MGNITKPTKEQAQQLAEQEERSLCAAADAIREADMFMLCVGAGFSADSGLAVYKDVAVFPAYLQRDLTYVDLCNPEWLEQDPCTFFGFWGKCFNDYRQTPPHEGYEIIKKWKARFAPSDNPTDPDHFPNEFVKESGCPPDVGAFFIYSSNVDGHFQKAGYSPNEIYEIHGSCEDWQCSFTCTDDVWKAPPGFEFEVDPETMLAPSKENNSLQGSVHAGTPGFSTNHPTCPRCENLSRPNVLMFGDSSWHDNREAHQRYADWSSRTKKSTFEGKKLVILEIGCGNNVPTVRMESESCLARTAPQSTTLIRINPDFPLIDRDQTNNTVISIHGKGLASLRKIDHYMNLAIRPAEVSNTL